MLSECEADIASTSSASFMLDTDPLLVLDHILEEHHSVDYGFRARRTSWYINIHWDVLVDFDGPIGVVERPLSRWASSN